MSARSALRIQLFRTLLYRAVVAVMCLGWLTASINTASAQTDPTLLSINLNPPFANFTTAGGSTTVSATLINGYSFPITLDSLFISPDLELLTDSTPFDARFVFPTDAQGNPLPQPVLQPGGRVSAALFDLTVLPRTPVGIYNITFGITGTNRTDGSDLGFVGRADFQVGVGAVVVPGPAALPLCALGFSGVGLLLRRKRK